MTSDSTDLTGRVALITGASRGIGRATAVEFARRGASVALWARTTAATPSPLPGTLEETVRTVEAAGGRALAIAVDVRKEGEVWEAADEVLGLFGRIDVLINNAAYFKATPVDETAPETWRLAMEVNLYGAIFCVQAVLPAMFKQGEGRVVNISSGAATQSFPGTWAYGASKAALEAFTIHAAGELAPEGIAVNALRIDSAVDTEGARFLNPDGDYSGWATPEEAARAIVWIAEQPAEWTGNIITMSDLSALS